MTEEEKKAIRRFDWINHLNKKFGREVALISSDSKHIETLLNLIEKLRNENERQQDIIIEKDRQLHLMHKEIQSVREQLWEITDKSLKDILMLNTHKIIIESKEDIKGLLDNYIPKEKIREKINELEKQSEEVKNFYKGTYACLDEYLNAKSKIQGYKELLEEE